MCASMRVCARVRACCECINYVYVYACPLCASMPVRVVCMVHLHMYVWCLFISLFQLFPDFHLKWLIDEFNHNLPLELDFMNEAMNAERVARNFAKDHTCPLYVP